MAKYKIIISDKCIGCGACTVVAPEYFELKRDKSKPKREIIGEEDLEKVKKAVDVCPVGAIDLIKVEE